MNSDPLSESPPATQKAEPAISLGLLDRPLLRVPAPPAIPSKCCEQAARRCRPRFEAVRGPIEKLGGKIKDGYFPVGSYDAVAITEMPDNVSAAAIAIAFTAGGQTPQGWRCTKH